MGRGWVLLAALSGTSLVVGCMAEQEVLGRDPGDDSAGEPRCETEPGGCGSKCTTRLFATVGTSAAESGALVEVSLEDGSLRVIAGIPKSYGSIRGMTFAKDLGAIYAIGRALSAPTLLQIQVDTGKIREIAEIRLADPDMPPLALAEGLAYDPCGGGLYLAAGSYLYFSDTIYRLDRKTGVATRYDAVEVQNDADGLAFVGCDLYFADSYGTGSVTYIARYDVEEAAFKLQRNVHGRIIGELTWDPLSKSLYGVAGGDRQIIHLDLKAENKDAVLGTMYEEGAYPGGGMGGLAAVQECEQ